MDKLILIELKKYVKSKVITESIGLGPEMDAILGRLGAGAESIINDLRSIYPSESILNSSEKSSVKLSRFISSGSDKMVKVLELALNKGLIKSDELVRIIDTSAPNLKSAIKDMISKGYEIDFIKQRFQNRRF
jgi:hypothetical protein